MTTKLRLSVGKSTLLIIGCLIGMLDVWSGFLGALVVIELLSIYEAIYLSE